MAAKGSKIRVFITRKGARKASGGKSLTLESDTRERLKAAAKKADQALRLEPLIGIIFADVGGKKKKKSSYKPGGKKKKKKKNKNN